MTLEKGFATTPAIVIFVCLYNHFIKQRSSVVCLDANVLTEISSQRNGHAEISRDWNGSDWNGQIEKARPKIRVPTVAMYLLITPSIACQSPSACTIARSSAYAYFQETVIDRSEM